MRVYILMGYTPGDENNPFIQGVFSTEEKAERGKKALKEGKLSHFYKDFNFYIKAWDVDKEVIYE